jgi:hypothetical protein
MALRTGCSLCRVCCLHRAWQGAWGRTGSQALNTHFVRAPAATVLSSTITARGRTQPFSWVSSAIPAAAARPFLVLAYALLRCFGVKLKPEGGGPNSMLLIAIQSAAASLASSVSRSLRPTKRGGRQCICGAASTVSRSPTGMYLKGAMSMSYSPCWSQCHTQRCHSASRQGCSTACMQLSPIPHSACTKAGLGLIDAWVLEECNVNPQALECSQCTGPRSNQCNACCTHSYICCWTHLWVKESHSSRKRRVVSTPRSSLPQCSSPWLTNCCNSSNRSRALMSHTRCSLISVWRSRAC